jgi:hypothetical protein
MAKWKVRARRDRLLRQAKRELVFLHEHCSTSVRSSIGDFEANVGRRHRQHVVCAGGWSMAVAQHRVAEAYGEGEDGVWHKGDGEEGAHHSALVGVSGVGRFAGGARSFELRQIPQSKKASAGDKAVNCQRYVRVPPTQHPRATATKGAVFSEPAFFFYERAQLAPYE